MHFATGTAAGIVKVYDIRSSRPVTERNHMNGFPIVSLSFHIGERDGDKLLVGSADTRSVKIWDASSGAMKASVESAANINHLTFCPRSGLFFCANDQQRVGVFFVPSLGLAPKWCSFLDNITEELEESTQKTVYEDYQFVTADMLEQLGASELIGTKFLQPYMHGYFMDHRLHGKLKAAANPFAFDEYRKQRIREKVDQKRKMRTTVRKSKVDVNPELHRRLQVDVDTSNDKDAGKKKRQAGEKAKSLLTDERFQALFADPDFAIANKGPTAEFEAASASISKALAGKTTKTRGKKLKKGN
jgi:ribosome biogenesis protein ENP2